MRQGISRLSRKTESSSGNSPAASIWSHPFGCAISQIIDQSRRAGYAGSRMTNAAPALRTPATPAPAESCDVRRSRQRPSAESPRNKIVRQLITVPIELSYVQSHPNRQLRTDPVAFSLFGKQCVNRPLPVCIPSSVGSGRTSSRRYGVTRVY